jgi:hypothetical protein
VKLRFLADTGDDMEDNQNFNDVLFQAILDRQQMFDSILLPKLLEEFRISQSSAKTIMTVLLKKGILHDDPYKYDSKVAEIMVPPDDPFTDNEKASIIGRRMSQYEAMLDYMSNYYQFTCDFLTADRINRLVALNKTFAWESFSPTSNKPNTKGLAEFTTTIRNGNDPLSISIVNDALSQLSRSSASITKTLKSLTEFHRERYKTAIRRLVMPSVVIDTGTLSSGSSAAMKEIKKSFAQNMKEQPFYTDLIEEILKEDYADDKETLRRDLLARLASARAEKGKVAQEISLKPVLLDGIRILGGVSPQLDVIVGKLAESHNAIRNAEKGFFQKLMQNLRKAFNIPEEKQEIAITTVDPVTQTGKRETVDFNPFIEDLRRRSRIYTGFSVRSSPAYQKVEGMQEQQILDLLTRHVAELSGMLKQCAGLDDYFKQNAPVEVRDHIHGIKVEISAIRNNLVKANQCRAEYSSQVEEQQQLKKLGITNV